MPHTPWSEIDIPPDIRKQVEESEEGIPDEVIEDATSGIPGLLHLESKEGDLFLKAAKKMAGKLGQQDKQNGSGSNDDHEP